MRVTILSRGSCPREAIELIGLSTKRDDAQQVGQFGSGTAFAMALSLREGMSISVSSHDEKGPYVMEPWANAKGRISWRFRPGSPLVRHWWDSVSKAMGRAVSRATSFTTGFGELDWQGQWPVLREFITNARDADPDGYAVFSGDEPPVEEYLEAARRAGYEAVTAVVIEGFNLDILTEWDSYFRFERPQGFEAPSWHDFYRRSPLVAIMNAVPGDRAALFVKGVRVEHGVPGDSLFSWSLDLDLTEARTLKRDYDFRWYASSLLNEACQQDPDLARRVLEWVEENPNSFEATLSMEYHTTTYRENNVWAKVMEGRTVAAKTDKVVAPSAVVLPSSWKAGLEKVGVEVARRPLEGGTGPVVFAKPEPKAEEEAPIDPKEVLQSLVQNAVLDIMQSRGLIGVMEHERRHYLATEEDLEALCKSVGFDWAVWGKKLQEPEPEEAETFELEPADTEEADSGDLAQTTEYLNDIPF